MPRTHFDPDSRTDADSYSRRKLVATGGALLAGGAGLTALASYPASAQVTMGDLAVSGDTATVDSPPEHIDVSVSGEYSVGGGSTPEQVRTVLQLHLPNDDADDMSENVYMDSVESGTYTLSADLMNHRSITDSMVTPSTAGETVTLDILVRVILLIVNGGPSTTRRTSRTPLR